MNEDFHNYQLIDRYLRNELPVQELEVFNQKLRSDKEFAEAVDLQKLSNDLIVEERFYSIMDEMDHPAKGKPWKKGIIISSVILLLLTGAYFIKNSDKDNPVKDIKPVTLPEKADSSAKELREEVKTSFQEEIIQPKIKDPVDKEKKSPVNTVEELYSMPVAPQAMDDHATALKDENIVLPVKKDPCGNTFISAEVQTHESCEGESTGMIEIPMYALKGGEEPYSFSLNDQYQSSNIFMQVAPGSYDLKIKDQNGCIEVRKNVTVKSKRCVKFESFSFNPSYGEFWKFPAGENQDFKVRITNKQGVQVYAIEVKGGSPYEWDGRSSAGSPLPSGTYFYVLEFPDGRTGQGYISIIQ